MFLGDVTTMKPETIARIRKKFLRDGRILIWVGSPGALSGESLAEISKAFDASFSMPAEIRRKNIFIDRERDPLLKDVSGFLLTGRHHNVRYYLKNLAVTGKDLKVLGCYQGTDIPGAVMRKTGDATEIIIGQQGAVTPQLLQNIARNAGIRLVTEGKDLMIRGGGLIVLGQA